MKFKLFVVLALATITAFVALLTRYVDRPCAERGGRLVHVEDTVSYQWMGGKLLRITTPVYTCEKLPIDRAKR